jgi:hypothetical protein
VHEHRTEARSGNKQPVADQSGLGRPLAPPLIGGVEIGVLAGVVDIPHPTHPGGGYQRQTTHVLADVAVGLLEQRRLPLVLGAAERGRQREVGMAVGLVADELAVVGRIAGALGNDRAE